MEIQEQSQGAVSVLKPVGALVATEAEQFKVRALEVAKEKLGRVMVDASAVPFVDSAGVEALVDITEELGQGGGVLKLCAVNATLREVLELTGWAEAFEYFEDVNTGVRSFL